MAGPMVVPTGIPGFDELIKGGLPRGSVINISGPTGSGKTIFALQFLYNGIKKHNEAGLYISFGEKKRLIYKNVAGFGWNLPNLEKERKFVFIEYPLHEAKEFIAQENTLFNLIVELGIERIVIDPVAPLALMYDTEQKRREGLYKLVNVLRSWGSTSLLISEPEEKQPLGLEAVSDGVVHMYNFSRRGYRVRAIEIIKMHGTPYVSKVCPIRLTDDGVKVYPQQYLYEE